MLNVIYRLYIVEKKLSKVAVKKAVQKKLITAEQYKTITGENYL